MTIWTLPLFGIESVLGYAINAAGADAAQARASLPAAICNVTLTIVLMSRLGIAGACVAGYLGHLVHWYEPGEGASFVGAVIGAIIILLIYRLVARRRV